jgi:hypothetical protein
MYICMGCVSMCVCMITDLTCALCIYAWHQQDMKTDVGSIKNVWPGCNARGLCCGASIDNYVVNLPPDATADQKALLLTALFLVVS